MLKSLLSKITGNAAISVSEEPDSPASRKAMVRLLRKAFSAQENLDIEVDNHLHHRTSYMIDNPPSLIEWASAQGLSESEIDANIEKKYANYQEKYVPGAYLSMQKHVALIKPQHDVSLPDITPESALHISFYLGSTCIRFDSHWIADLSVDENECIRIAFPGRYESKAGRQYHRARSNNGGLGTIYFKLPDSDLITTQLLDISAGGASFQITKDMPKIELHRPVGVALKFPGRKEFVKVKAMTRNISTLAILNERGTLNRVLCCGVQFMLEHRSIANVIEEEVVKLQRMELQRFRGVQV